MRPSATCALAEHEAALVLEDRRDRFQVALAFTRLSVAQNPRRPGRVAEEAAQELLACTDCAPTDRARADRRPDLRAMTLIEVGIAAMWAGRLEEGERHLDLALEEARGSAGPELELLALAHRPIAEIFRVQGTGKWRAREAIELARKHGWEEDLRRRRRLHRARRGALWRGRVDEAEHWLELAKGASRRMKPTDTGDDASPVGPCWSSSAAGPRRR